jgi:BirA family transcriptional regulator, biotin operon repressor / biotin---[acetyl-CoA-carboxylase] ligase
VAVNQIVGHVVDRDELFAGILANLDPRYDQLHTDPDAVVADYRAACSTIGRRVRVELASGTFWGSASAVTDDGHLVVDDDGVVRTVSAGDVIHVRPG